MVNFEASDGGNRARSPLAVLREVQERMLKEDEGMVSEIGVGTIRWNHLFKGQIEVKYGFHEGAARNEFSFKPTPADHQPIGPNRQATPVTELGGNAGKMGRLLEEAFDVDFEFAELDAASIGGGGGLTDYEFKYEGFTGEHKVERANIEQVVRNLDEEGINVTA